MRPSSGRSCTQGEVARNFSHGRAQLFAPLSGLRNSL